jgi:hypothetical protein
MPEPTPTPTQKLNVKLIVEQPQAVNSAQRHKMTAEAAYFCAEKRAFVCGHMLDDWLHAEIAIDRMLQQQADELPEKKAYLKKLEASYRDWDAKHETLKKKASAAGTAKTEIREEIEVLAGKRAEFEIILKDLRQHTGDTWQDVKLMTENAWKELQEAFHRVVARMK